MKSICIFGASITWGANDLEKGGWVNRLRLWIDEKTDYQVTTYNLGVSGDTTKDLLEHFEIEAKAREPELIIFSIGINDAAFNKDTKENLVSLTEFAPNMAVLLEKAYRISKKVMIMGLSNVDEIKTNPIHWRNNLFYKTSNIIVYNTELKKISKEKITPFLDISNLLTKDDLSDGLHPKPEAHEKIFLTVKDFIIKNDLILFDA